LEEPLLAKVFEGRWLDFSPGISSQVILRRGAFPARLANWKWLMVSFSILTPCGQGEFLICDAFSQVLRAKASASRGMNTRGLTFEQFKAKQSKREKDGLSAELFVLQFERDRLGGGHEVIHIAPIDVGRGFDIHSRPGAGGTGGERMIEVKSFSFVPHFFLSSNEQEVAAKNRDIYYLYLVDRSRMQEGGYFPLIISDPFKAFFKDLGPQWAHSTLETHRFTMIEEFCQP
jgi:hypothetical protein